MMTKTTRGFILTLVAAYLTLVGADDLQEINCKDKDGCPPYHDEHETRKFEDDYEWRSTTAIGASVSTFIAIVIIITLCCFCACCPLYKYRNKGTVYTSATTQPQPVTIIQQPPYNTQQVNIQPFAQPPYPGFVYSPATTQQQPVAIHQQPPYNPQYTNAQQFAQPPNTGFVYSPGAPEQPPPYFQTSPQK